MTRSVEPDVATAVDFLAAIEAASAAGPGVTRASYGDGEQAAHDVARATGERLGLPVAVDPAGNLYVELAGADAGAPRTIVGSHLDSVPHGGNYDGAAGVAIGLAVIAGFVAAGRRPAAGLVVMGIRAEESAWFDASYVGSRAALGRLAESELATVRRADTGRSLGDHLREAGFDPSRIGEGRPIVPGGPIGRYIEPHIEQGPVLEDAGVPLGIVTAIRGSTRRRAARCIGRWDHSGATPRGARRDAVAATARLVCRLDDAWDAALAAGEDVAVTVGQFTTDPALHAFSKIAGEVSFSVDIRSTSPATLAHFEERLISDAREVEEATGVRFDLGPRSGSEPAVMDASLQAGLERGASDRGYRTLRLASGAGHDCAVFAAAGIPSAMLFVRSRGGSHNPEEAVSPDDLAAAARTLASFLSDP